MSMILTEMVYKPSLQT